MLLEHEIIIAVGVFDEKRATFKRVKCKPHFNSFTNLTRLNERKLVFLFGILPDEALFPIIKLSLGPVQFAADAFQRALIRGLCSQPSRDIKILNIPFVGSYPFTFRKHYFPSLRFDVENQNVLSLGFLNIALVQLPSRLIACMLALRKSLDKTPTAIIVYSAHLPFLLSALAHKLFTPHCVVILILPDMPEFMAAGSFFYRLAKKLENWIFFKLVKHVDGLVLISRHMLPELKLKKNIPSIVVEGIHNEHLENVVPVDTGGHRYLFYSGSLDRRYGILDLLQALSLVRDQSVELWVCGDGSGRDEVISAARLNPRIKYIGQLPRNEVLALQRAALALINPRRPEGLYTNLSFPSKTIEYLASGRPTIMHKLSGIPDEYFEHAIIPRTANTEGLATAIDRIALMSTEDQALMGRKAREFILNTKSTSSQVARVLALIDQL